MTHVPKNPKALCCNLSRDQLSLQCSSGYRGNLGILSFPEQTLSQSSRSSSLPICTSRVPWFYKAQGSWLFLLRTFAVVQSLSRVRLFVTPWTAARQASLSFTISWNLLTFSWWCHPTILSCESPLSFCPQSLPASECIPISQLFASGGQSVGASASASVLPINI